MKPLLTPLVAFSAGLLAPLTHAASYTLSGTDGLWSNTAVWSPAGTPGSADTLAITGTVGATVGLDTSKTITTFTPASTGTLTFTDQFSGGTPTLTVTGNYLQTKGTVIFDSGTALTVNGTTIVRGGSMLILSSTYTLTGLLTVGSGSSGSGLLGLTGDFSRTIGSGAGQILFGNDGYGFAAFGNNRSVTFNGGADVSTALSAMTLGHATATHTVTLTNNFSALTSVTVNDGAAVIDGAISGNISGAGNFVKAGAGTLALSGTNSHTGSTSISSGILVLNSSGALSGGSRLIISGGILGLGYGDFTNAVGAGGGQLTFIQTDATGFAAFGGDRTVNFSNGAIVWGTGTATGTSGFFTNGNGSNLILNVATSAHKLTFQNAVSLNGAQRILTVGNGTAAIDAAMTGVISGNNLSVLRKQGAGTLELTNANTYAGGTTIAEGTLLANNSTGSATGSAAIALSAGATFGGTGFAAGLVTTADVTSTFSPGSASGTTVSTLTLSGGINAAAGATFNFSLGTSSDLLSLGSGVFTGSTASGGLLFNITDSTGLQAGTLYTLLTFGSHTGLELSDLALSSIGAGFALDQFIINATSVQVRFSAVPEPSTYATLAGLLVLAGCVQRRRHRRS